jgi:hypothetical protein
MKMFYESPKHFFYATRRMLIDTGFWDKKLETDLNKWMPVLYNADMEERYSQSLCSTVYFNLKKFYNIFSAIKASIRDIKSYKYVHRYEYPEFTKELHPELSKKSFKEIEALKEKSGVYYLYNYNKSLIYIGKSQNLRFRMMESVKERKASYARYSIIDNLSDMHILEVYLIAKHKPSRNVSCVSSDKPSIKLKEPIKSEYIRITKSKLV